jgi:multimeric flavodoxin WrbA
MNILIHDLKDFNETILVNQKETVIISDNGKIHPCICCFGCWIKTPGQCVIKDGYDNMGELMSKSSRLIIISQCLYGGYSPFVKNVIDKSISYLLPYFKIKNGETHHKRRYDNNIDLIVYFYGKITESEKETARKLIKANGINMYMKTEVHFYTSYKEIKEVYE